MKYSRLWVSGAEENLCINGWLTMEQGGLHQVRGQEEIVVQDPEDDNASYRVDIETVGF